MYGHTMVETGPVICGSSDRQADRRPTQEVTSDQTRIEWRRNLDRFGTTVQV